MKIRNRLLAVTLGWMIYATLRLIFGTVRKRFYVADPDSLAYLPEPKGRYLFCTWHDSILLPLFMGRPHHMSAIVSRHRDGGYLTDLMKKLSIHCVRGSSTAGGVEALREAMTVARKRHITVTPDGPRGPRRQMKDGIVFLASKARRPIVPMAFHCERCWRIQGRWTDLVVPKPFSRVHMVLDDPVSVPERISRDELSKFTSRLQEKMDAICHSAELQAERKDSAPGTASPESRTEEYRRAA